MRYRIKEYTIGGDTDFFVSGKIGVEDIRLIINETQKKVICSSMNKSNVACEYVEDMDATFISFSSSICILQPSDKLTIEVDKGDTLTQVASKVEEESEAIKSKIDAIPATDLTAVAKEETLNTLADKIDNIKLPEIDTTELAKQGDDKNATLTAIYKMLVGNDEPSQDIPEGVAERLALILEFFGIKPIQAYEFMTPEEVCSTLEDIMTSMDLELTPEKAAEITSNTLNN